MLYIVRCSLVICNLYPFSQTVSAADVTVGDAVEQIDIGNLHVTVWVICATPIYW